MSFRASITKDCFPPATTCHNCMRKRRYEVTGKPEQMIEFKRCSGCHVMTYCDQDCQREHWVKVHRKYCKFLSGRKVAENTKHSIATCPLCTTERHDALGELFSGNSPKTKCHVDHFIVKAREILDFLLDFHQEGKTCSCSVKIGCGFPFPFGELSGKYVDELGIDLMLAHAIEIVYAMGTKYGRSETIILLWQNLISCRVAVWLDIMLRGEVQGLNDLKKEILLEPLNDLKKTHGNNNPWCKALKFAISFVDETFGEVSFCKASVSSLENNPRLKNIKLVLNYRQSELSKKAMISASDQWGKFKLWPTLENNFLSLVLPDGTLCQSCHKPLRGSVNIILSELHETDAIDRSLPTLLPHISDDGGLLACCSIDSSPMCLVECTNKNVRFGMYLEDGSSKDFKKEMKKFMLEGRGCDMCLKWSMNSHRCSACKAAQYCSSECQRKDLEFHKTVCASWAVDESRKIVSGKEQKNIHKSMRNNN